MRGTICLCIDGCEQYYYKCLPIQCKGTYNSIALTHRYDDFKVQLKRRRQHRVVHVETIFTFFVA